ncbi:glycosyltransferase family 2 protein [bacterium]|nr:glycosyltransferase family 2 protein [bacterium]
MPELSLSVIIPAYNARDTIQSCITALLQSRRPLIEIILIDDSSTDDGLTHIDHADTKIIRLKGGPRGPAFARNRGAEAASGDILIFIDADVIVHGDTLAQIKEEFLIHSDMAALFGSYDDQPPAPGLLSQYKNLVHHFVHHEGEEEAFTFWAGCGAIRRNIFLQIGGFNEDFTRPSVEDIELGYRLRFAGHSIRLCPWIQATHLKRWTLLNIIKTDIFARAIPWTRLILSDKRIPYNLNVETKSRWSAVLAWGALGAGTTLLLVPWAALGIPVMLIGLAWLNRNLFDFFLRKKGVIFTLGAFALHFMYLLYSSMVFLLVGTSFFMRRLFSPTTHILTKKK